MFKLPLAGKSHTPGRSKASRTVNKSKVRARPPRGSGSLFHQDEVGEVFSSSYLTDLKDGNCSVLDDTGRCLSWPAGRGAERDGEFDHVFRPGAGQAVFAKLSQLVQSAFDGYNVCIFIYDKTFTLEGGEDEEADEALAGMIPMTIQKIFLVQLKLKAKSWVYKLQASFLEVYNEEIRDLASENPIFLSSFHSNIPIFQTRSSGRSAPLLLAPAEGRWQ